MKWWSLMMRATCSGRRLAPVLKALLAPPVRMALKALLAPMALKAPPAPPVTMEPKVRLALTLLCLARKAQQALIQQCLARKAPLALPLFLQMLATPAPSALMG